MQVQSRGVSYFLFLVCWIRLRTDLGLMRLILGTVSLVTLLALICHRVRGVGSLLPGGVRCLSRTRMPETTGQHIPRTSQIKMPFLRTLVSHTNKCFTRPNQSIDIMPTDLTRMEAYVLGAWVRPTRDSRIIHYSHSSLRISESVFPYFCRVFCAHNLRATRVATNATRYG
jgi:hypothetical protein